eukprot:gene6069-10077_t
MLHKNFFGTTYKLNKFIHNSYVSNFQHIGSLAHDGKFNELRKFYREKKMKLTTNEYNMLISCAKSTNKFDQYADEILHEMVDKNLPITRKTVGHLIHGYCKNSQVDLALNVFQEMKGNIVYETIDYVNIIVALGKAGQIDEMKKFYTEMVDVDHVKPNIATLTFIIKSLKNAKRMVAASNFLNELERFGFEPTIEIYTSLISGYFANEDFKRAIEIFEILKIKNLPIDGFVYGIMISGCSTSKIYDKAETFYQEMVQKEVIPTTVAFNVFLSKLCLGKKVESALKYFKEQKDKVKIDKISYTTLIHGLLENEKPKEAEELFNEMKEKNIPLDHIVYKVIIQYNLENDNLDNAVKLLNEMKDKKIALSLEIFNKY